MWVVYDILQISKYLSLNVSLYYFIVVFIGIGHRFVKGLVVMLPDKPSKRHFPSFFQNDIDIDDAERQAFSAAWEYIQTQQEEFEQIYQESKEKDEVIEIAEQRLSSNRSSRRWQTIISLLLWGCVIYVISVSPKDTHTLWAIIGIAILVNCIYLIISSK